MEKSHGYIAIIGDIIVSGFCIMEALRHSLVIFAVNHMTGGRIITAQKIKYHTKMFKWT